MKAFTVSGVYVEVSGIHAEVSGTYPMSTQTKHGIRNACRRLRITSRALRNRCKRLGKIAWRQGYVYKSEESTQRFQEHVQGLMKAYTVSGICAEVSAYMQKS